MQDIDSLEPIQVRYRYQLADTFNEHGIDTVFLIREPQECKTLTRRLGRSWKEIAVCQKSLLSSGLTVKHKSNAINNSTKPHQVIIHLKVRIIIRHQDCKYRFKIKGTLNSI